jgi:3-deoxy-D-manno-octulosonic acid kinase
VPLPDATTHVVVRHGWHGGLLRRLTRDRFLAPTRAPHELAAALTLRARGVRTPEIVAYVIYPAGPLLRRSDVASREVPRARDLALTLLGPPDATVKAAALEATATLLARMAAAGAQHADLNLKNVLLEPAADGALAAWLIDVDRVRFHPPGDARVTARNLARLSRSARKWARLYGADVTEDDLAWLARRVAEPRP